MIRIDEIYYNVFVSALRHRSRIGLHWFDPFGSKCFEDLVARPLIECTSSTGRSLGPQRRIIFWDQEPLYRSDAELFFNKFCNIYRPPREPKYHISLTLVTSEINSEDVSWIQDTYKIENTGYYFFHGWAALDWYRGYNYSYLSTPWMERKFHHRLFSANNIVGGNRSHRLFLLSELDRRDLISDNLISFPAVCPYEHKTVDDLFMKHDLPKLSSSLPLIIDHGSNHASNSHCIDFWDQAQSCFCHVVTETVYQSNRLHLTEKTFKPIVLQQPFMLVAPRGSLEYLKSYGFKTFDSIWPETYDQADDDVRIKMIVDNLERINAWTSAELKDAALQAQSIIKHNFDWFYGEFKQILWKELTTMLESWQ
jgi:hypothetical protein